MLQLLVATMFDEGYNLQWYLKHHGGENGTEPGTKRARPFSGDMTTSNGRALATKYMQWVGDNCPGMEYARKAKNLVRTDSVCC